LCARHGVDAGGVSPLYRALDAPAFNGNFNAGIAPTKKDALVATMDMIWLF
jgi:hypothetical protein